MHDDRGKDFYNEVYDDDRDNQFQAIENRQMLLDDLEVTENRQMLLDDLEAIEHRQMFLDNLDNLDDDDDEDQNNTEFVDNIMAELENVRQRNLRTQESNETDNYQRVLENTPRVRPRLFFINNELRYSLYNPRTRTQVLNNDRIIIVPETLLRDNLIEIDPNDNNADNVRADDVTADDVTADDVNADDVNADDVNPNDVNADNLL